jgi:hypothetical protein
MDDAESIWYEIWKLAVKLAFFWLWLYVVLIWGIMMYAFGELVYLTAIGYHFSHGAI